MITKTTDVFICYLRDGFWNLAMRKYLIFPLAESLLVHYADGSILFGGGSVYRRWYTAKDSRDIDKARRFEDLTPIALRIITRIFGYRGRVEMVCGPISTGGVGSFRDNFKTFATTISKLVRRSLPVFSQVPFEVTIQLIKALPGQDETKLLETLYRPIFASGMIKRCYFIHGWETSYGARWERERCLEYGIEIVNLPKGFHMRTLWKD